MFSTDILAEALRFFDRRFLERIARTSCRRVAAIVGAHLSCRPFFVIRRLYATQTDVCINAPGLDLGLQPIPIEFARLTLNLAHKTAHEFDEMCARGVPRYVRVVETILALNASTRSELMCALNTTWGDDFPAASVRLCINWSEFEVSAARELLNNIHAHSISFENGLGHLDSPFSARLDAVRRCARLTVSPPRFEEWMQWTRDMVDWLHAFPTTEPGQRILRISRVTDPKVYDHVLARITEAFDEDVVTSRGYEVCLLDLCRENIRLRRRPQTNEPQPWYHEWPNEWMPAVVVRERRGGESLSTQKAFHRCGEHMVFAMLRIRRGIHEARDRKRKLAN